MEWTRNAKRFLRSTVCSAGVAGLASGLAAVMAADAQARITHIEFSRVESPTFAGADFGPVGKYEKLVGTAYGELDPANPLNAVIQDINLALRNARGMVEYLTDIYVLKPVDMAKGNKVLFHDVVNRGGKRGISVYNFGVAQTNDPTNPGDGFLMNAGYSLIWFGWQGDVISGADRMTINVPVAKNADGSTITGVVVAELIAATASTTLNLYNGAQGPEAHEGYATASLDNRAPLANGFLPTLTVRTRQWDVPVVIPNSQWSFGACSNGTAVTPNDRRICLPAGFKLGQLYELTYMAKDPLVLGIGFAAMRDVAAFFKNEPNDDAGKANPLYIAGSKAILQGNSQSGRAARTFLMLGFNQDEKSRIVYEGAYPHIAGGLVPLNVRFGQPGRSGGDQVDHLFPGYGFPFAYGTTTEPLTGRTGGILDRCMATNTCPRIMHVATALELWDLRQSLGFTDPLGTIDLQAPDNVRQYVMTSTQHGAAATPLATAAPFGNCQQQPNPNPQIWTVRAMFTAMTQWVMNDVPPPSTIPTIREATLVPPSALKFPAIPANNYGGVERPAVKFTGRVNGLGVLDFGPQFDAANITGILAPGVPKVGDRQYSILVPQIDADGNDLGGVQSITRQVPIGTYTGWNTYREGMFGGEGLCHLTGSFIPFAATRAERTATGDPRLSIEERYPTNADYVTKVAAAAERLVAQRFLLPDDAKRLVDEAAKSGIGNRN